MPDGLDDGDDNTQLSESEVDGMVADNGYAMAADAFSRMWSDLIGVPEDLADGDDTLSEDEVDAYVADDIAALIEEIAVLREQVVELESTVEDASESSVGTVMYGDYFIYNSADLAALEDFTEVRGKLHIESSGLPDLHALSALTTVTNEVLIQNCGALTSLEGLDGLINVGSIKISQNDLLTSLGGLSALTNIGDGSGDLQIQGNPLLTSLEGLENVTQAGNVNVLSSRLLSFRGLNNLAEIRDLHAYYNHDLLTLDGLESLTTVSGDIHFSDNSSLTTTAGLDGLVTIRGLGFANNESLSSIDSLFSIEEFTGSTLTLRDHPSLCTSAVESFQEHLAAIGASITSRWVYSNGPC